MKREHGGIRRGLPARAGRLQLQPLPLGAAARRCAAFWPATCLPETVPYPDPGYRSLREATGALCRLPGPKCVYPANGSEEIFFWLCRLLAPRVAVVIGPTYSEYALAAQAAGAEVRQLSCEAEEGFRLDLAAAEQRRPEADLVFVCNPNNPTGDAGLPRGDKERSSGC